MAIVNSYCYNVILLFRFGYSPSSEVAQKCVNGILEVKVCPKIIVFIHSPGPPSCLVHLIYILHLSFSSILLRNCFAQECFCTYLFVVVWLKLKKIQHKYSPPARSWVECNFQSTMVDYLRGRWWSRSSPSTPDCWHCHMLLLLQKVFWLFCFASASFF